MLDLAKKSLFWAGLFFLCVLIGGVFWESLIGQIKPVILSVLEVTEKINTPIYTAAAIFLKNAFVVVLCVFLGMRAVVPTVICVVNGIVIGAVGGFLHVHGTSWLNYFLALAPHGVFELPAIFLACAIGMSLYTFKEKLKLALAPLGMLAVAACIETWVSPLVAHRIL